ncbi:MAG: acetate kinase [Oscillospiraceae bacterium]|nr:acetate kinase [Oscillospiraceae bacterium]
MKVLVINAGSSSLKYQLMQPEDGAILAKGLCERIGIDGSLTHKVPGKEDKEFSIPMPTHAEAINAVLAALTNPEYGVISSMDEIDAVGHRVVHGGEEFASSVLIDKDVMDALYACVPLAPLHNPANITGIEACRSVIPNVPMVAVFDTAFHQTIPPKAFLYALPYEYYTENHVRRYGFHGTSHFYVSRRAAEMVGRPIEELKIVSCHLGNGSSVTAINGGKSVDTSMGFTPLDGLPMGTRCGAIDPSIVEYLMQVRNMTAEEVNDVMNKKSGVLGISGVSSDFRDLDKAAAEGNERAQLAIDLFCYKVTKRIGSAAAGMGGVDVVIFTAGVGENSADLRAKIVSGLEFIGIAIDPEKNNTRGKETDISAPGAKVHTLIVPTNEELVIAMDTASIVGKK